MQDQGVNRKVPKREGKKTGTQRRNLGKGPDETWELLTERGVVHPAKFRKTEKTWQEER